MLWKRTNLLTLERINIVNLSLCFVVPSFSLSVSTAVRPPRSLRRRSSSWGTTQRSGMCTVSWMCCILWSTRATLTGNWRSTQVEVRSGSSEGRNGGQILQYWLQFWLQPVFFLFLFHSKHLQINRLILKESQITIRYLKLLRLAYKAKNGLIRPWVTAHLLSASSTEWLAISSQRSKMLIKTFLNFGAVVVEQTALAVLKRWLKTHVFTEKLHVHVRN